MVCFYDVFVFGVSDIPMGLAILREDSQGCITRNGQTPLTE